MSDYIMEPGARLEIGPHGQPEEQLGLGACCAACAQGGALGADPVSSSWPTYLAVAGVAGLGLLLVLGRRKRRR